MFVNHFFHKRAVWINKVMPEISMAGIACIIIVITEGTNNLLTVGAALALATFLHMKIGVTPDYLGRRLFGLPKLNCINIAIEVGMQNDGLASAITVQMGKIVTIGLVPAVNGRIMNTTCSLIATWCSSKPAYEQEAEIPGNIYYNVTS